MFHFIASNAKKSWPRGGSRIFFRRGYTRLLLYFNTSKPHSFFLQNTSCTSQGEGGVRTPCTLPLDPPLWPSHFLEWINVRPFRNTQTKTSDPSPYLYKTKITGSENNKLEVHRRSQYEANRGTRLGKILPNTVDFYFFYQTDNMRRFHTADFVQRTVCSPRL